MICRGGWNVVSQEFVQRRDALFQVIYAITVHDCTAYPPMEFCTREGSDEFLPLDAVALEL